MTLPLYDHPVLSAACFFPEGSPRPPQAPGGEAVRIPHPGGFDLSGWQARPFPGAPTIVVFHGNGESVEDDLRLWPAWSRELGLNLLLVDYPGYGASGGAPSFTACRQAGRAAVRWALEGPDGGAGVILTGRSWGSWVALTAAEGVEDRVRGAILESGIADLGQRLIDRIDYEAAGLDAVAVIDAIRRDFDLQARVRALPCPVLVLHARHDTLVPSWHGRRLAEWAGERLFRCALFAEGDHNDVYWENRGEYRALVAEFVGAVL
jgi:hypothetical protein